MLESRLRSTILLMLLSGLVVAGCSRPAADAPSVVTVAFGSGGSGCSVTGEASTFAVGEPIHMVATFSPPLAAGTTVTMTIERNGSELPGGRDTLSTTEPTPCVYHGLQHLEVGTYRVRYSVEPGSMPPATGDFEITPR